MKKVATYLVMACLVVTLSACGTILYPERRGQTSGQLDPAIVLLDAIGLLVFFVPGVIAFAVDFSNGTIYLPDGSSATLDADEMDQVVTNDRVDVDALNALLREKTGRDVSLDTPLLEVSQLQSREQLPAALAAAETERFASL